MSRNQPKKEMPEMADTNKAADAPVASTVPHDRVVGLSLKSDGTPDQNNPEIIGDKEAALEATKKQFREFSVSAVDAEKRAELGLAGAEEGDTSDALIDKLKAEHEKTEKAADKRAESVVNALHQG